MLVHRDRVVVSALMLYFVTSVTRCRAVQLQPPCVPKLLSSASPADHHRLTILCPAARVTGSAGEPPSCALRRA